MNRDELINNVKAAMDEITPFSEGEMVSSSNIDKMLDFAIEQVVKTFPVYLLPVITKNNITPTKNPDGSGKFTAPQDMFRFVSLTMKGWLQPAKRLVKEDTIEYKIQKDIYLRGGVSHPVAAEIKRNGQTMIEYYSLPVYVEPEIEEFAYIGDFEIEDLDERITEAIMWNCATLVYSAQHDADGISITKTNYQQLLLSAYEGQVNTGRG